ncbi:MAG: hypothetical protein WBD40_21190, partial [Tepidisphaeraceae bacterium]
DPARPSGAAGGRVGDEWEDAPAPERPPEQAFKDVSAHLAEMKEYAAYYVAAKADAMKASVRSLGLYAALGVVGLIAGGAIIVTSAVLLLSGLAGAIGAVFDPDLPWGGHLVVGALVLGGMGTGAMLFMKKFTAASRERTVKKYESRKQQQRVQHGHDVRERAEEAGRAR